MLAAILDFSARHHLCQFMPAVSETTDNREHFDIWHILLYWGVRITPRKSGQFHSLSPYQKEMLYVLFPNDFDKITLNTVDSRYLEFQGTLLNTSRYPYLDI